MSPASLALALLLVIGYVVAVRQGWISPTGSQPADHSQVSVPEHRPELGTDRPSQASPPPTTDDPAAPRRPPTAAQSDSRATTPANESRQSDDNTSGPETPANSSDRLLVKNVTLRDLDGNVAYRGTVDLSGTVRRIEQGRRLEYHNDGSVFQNREGRLPRQAAGYYHEYVHPTPELSGPGPQRIVVGKNGEYFYTPDHYRTFERIR